MRIFVFVGLLAAAACWAQEAASNPQPPSSQVSAQAAAASQKQTITVPAGTRISLSLASPITSKAARPGGSVRAVTGFPVTVGTQLVIPVGTYVEGVIDKVTKKGRPDAGLQMHFTRMLFPSGYGVAIDGANTQGKVLRPEPNSTEIAALPSVSGANYALPSQSTPALTPPPHVGPSTGEIVGIAVASAVPVVAILLWHRGRGDRVIFDTGWQFEMVLQSPLTLDAASVAAAVAAPSAQ